MRLASALVALAAFLLAGACGDDDGAAEGRGMEPGRGAAAGAGSGAPQAPAVNEDPLRPSTDPRAGRIRLGDAPAQPSEAAGEEAAREPGAGDAPERDLSAELRQKVGDPSSCLGGIDDLPDEVTLRVSATVTGSGVVTRSTVSGPVPDSARDCVSQRLGAARFPGPIEGAPRTITTSLTVRRQAAE